MSLYLDVQFVDDCRQCLSNLVQTPPEHRRLILGKRRTCPNDRNSALIDWLCPLWNIILIPVQPKIELMKTTAVVDIPMAFVSICPSKCVIATCHRDPFDDPVLSVVNSACSFSWMISEEKIGENIDICSSTFLFVSLEIEVFHWSFPSRQPVELTYSDISR